VGARRDSHLLITDATPETANGMHECVTQLTQRSAKTVVPTMLANRLCYLSNTL
jgi:hypothetical protein